MLICALVKWIKMEPLPGHSSVCFGSHGDKPGNFTSPSSGKIITFKLIHLNGGVSCLRGVISNWGCNVVDWPEKMETLITDSERNRLLPANDQLFSAPVCNEMLFYNLTGHTPDSSELLFDNFTSPLPVTANQQFSVWFAEDLYDCEFDNGIEQACVQVYGLFV